MSEPRIWLSLLKSVNAERDCLMAARPVLEQVNHISSWLNLAWRMLTSSILTTIQLDRSLFSDDPEGALTEFLLAACSASEGLDLGLDCPSETCERKHSVTASYNTFRKVCILVRLWQRLWSQSVYLHFVSEKTDFLWKGKIHTWKRLSRDVLGWLGQLSVWPREAKGLCSPLVLLQQFSSPLGLSLHGSTVTFPVSTSISCVKAAVKRLLRYSTMACLLTW